MKVAISSFILIVFAVVAIAADKDFDEWAKKHNKNYASAEHKEKAEKKFKANDNLIKTHNARHDAGEETFTMAHNLFSDLSAEEYQAKLVDFEKIKRDTPMVRSGSTPITVPSGWVPGNLDLTAAVISVKEQGDCHSCWAFSANGVFEYRLLKLYSTYYDLSEQNAVDCAKLDKSGCPIGGWMHEAFNYYLVNGVNYEYYYPYTGLTGTCNYQSTAGNIGTGIDARAVPQWYTVPNNELLLAYIVSQKGWVSVCVNMDKIPFLSTGIVKASSCSLVPNHAVIAVGYGKDTTTGLDYWLLKNSWGTSFGVNGYFKIQRGANACDINNAYPYYRVHLA